MEWKSAGACERLHELLSQKLAANVFRFQGAGPYLGKFDWGGGGGAVVYHVAVGHSEGKCVGGGCAPSCTKCGS